MVTSQVYSQVDGSFWNKKGCTSYVYDLDLPMSIKNNLIFHVETILPILKRFYWLISLRAYLHSKIWGWTKTQLEWAQWIRNMILTHCVVLYTYAFHCCHQLWHFSKCQSRGSIFALYYFQIEIKLDIKRSSSFYLVRLICV